MVDSAEKKKSEAPCCFVCVLSSYAKRSYTFSHRFSFCLYKVNKKMSADSTLFLYESPKIYSHLFPSITYTYFDHHQITIWLNKTSSSSIWENRNSGENANKTLSSKLTLI